jgi:glycosyltransferase involved in cell wall biosynthesis
MHYDNELFFSIVIPAYNIEKYIQKAIQSVFNQNFQNYEIIIVNDGSTDNTSNIIDNYSIGNNKISVINHFKNESQHVARMNGVNSAKGQYTLFLDGDDYYSDNALFDLYNEIKNNPDYDFYEFGFTEQPSGKQRFPFYSGDNRFLAYFDKEVPLVNCVWNKVYDTTLLKKAFSNMKRVFINNAQDLYESIIIAYYAKKTMNINKTFYNYLIGRGISTTYKDYNQTITYMQSIKTINTCLKEYFSLLNLDIPLDNLNYKYMEKTIDGYIINQKTDKDMKALFLTLSDYFNSNIILLYLYNLSQKHRFQISSLIDSKDYKLGKFLLFPVRKIYQIIRLVLKKIY